MSAAVQKTVEIDGGAYTLVAKFGTMRLAEKELGVSIPSLVGNIENIGFDAISGLFWAFLQPKHRITRDAADNLIDEAGFNVIVDWVGACLSDYFGGGETADEEEAGNASKAKGKKAG